METKDYAFAHTDNTQGSNLPVKLHHGLTKLEYVSTQFFSNMKFHPDLTPGEILVMAECAYRCAEALLYVCTSGGLPEKDFPPFMKEPPAEKLSIKIDTEAPKKKY